MKPEIITMIASTSEKGNEFTSVTKLHASLQTAAEFYFFVK